MTVRTYDDPLFRQLPPLTQGSLRHYIEHRLRPGHYLTAVLSNDLVEAVNRADRENLDMLGYCVRWLVWYAPPDCWGSPSAVRMWLAGVDEDARR